MDLGKYSRNGTWLFADRLQKPITLEFVEAREQPDKNGKMFPVLCCVGKNGEYVGDVFISIWRMQLGEKLKEKLGSDTSKWGTPLLTCSTTANNKILVELS